MRKIRYQSVRVVIPNAQSVQMSVRVELDRNFKKMTGVSVPVSPDPSAGLYGEQIKVALQHAGNIIHDSASHLEFLSTPSVPMNAREKKFDETIGDGELNIIFNFDAATTAQRILYFTFKLEN